MVATKRDLEVRIASLEDGLAQARDLIDEILDVEDEEIEEPEADDSDDE